MIPDEKIFAKVLFQINYKEPGQVMKDINNPVSTYKIEATVLLFEQIINLEF